MEISKINDVYGVEIKGVDLKKISSGQIDSLKCLLAENGLLIIRDQLLEDRDLYQISIEIGNGKLEKSARKICHSKSFPEVSYLTNLQDPNGGALGFPGLDTDFWHSDQEFKPAPATIATLYCLIAPQLNGQTSFAYTEATRISDVEDINEFRGMRSTRVPAKTHDNVEQIEVSHPLLLKNPITNKEFVYISDNAIRFEGEKSFSQDESNQLKESLLTKILTPANIYSHQWRLGDFIIYDNTQLVHRREHSEGIRWLKATKIFADQNYFAVPRGNVNGMAEDVRFLEQQKVRL